MDPLDTGGNALGDAHVLCVELAPECPMGLQQQLETLVERVRWVQGTAEALKAMTRRPPEATLVAAGDDVSGVWFACGVLQVFDPDLPCLVLVSGAEAAAEAAAMAPGAYVLDYPARQSLLPAHLSAALQQSRRRRKLHEQLQLKHTMIERMPSPVALVEHGECTVTLANGSAREIGLHEGRQCFAELLPDVFHNPPWNNKGVSACGFLHGAAHGGRHWDVFATWLPNGQLMLTATDVSGRVQAEAQLQRSEERLRRLVQNSAVGLYVADLEGRFQMTNPAYAAMLGFATPEQLVADVRSMDSQVYVREGRRQEMLEALQRGEVVRDWISEVYGRDGDMLWLQESLTPVYDSEGGLCGCEASVLDITQRHYAEQGRRSALAMLHRTFDSISDIVLLIDLDQSIVLCNTSFAREFDQDKDAVPGAPLGRFLLGSGLGGESRTLKQYLGSEQEYNFLLKGARQDGTYMTSMSPFHDETGNVVGAILIARNVDSITAMVNTVVEADA